MPSSIKELIEKNASRPAIARVWQRFAEISKIPRLSGNEAGVRDYLVGFARDRKLAHEIDAVGNVLIEIPATHGWENVFGAILQAHMDMVCVHDQGFPDPAVKGVVPLVDEAKEWVYARGTSLGADNAIGLAIALALVDDPEITHGPLKIMATVDEEQGLQGASKISFKDLDTGNDKYLINLDSEDFGEVYIGCAGGGDSVISLPIEREAISNKTILGLKLEGLAGGHSGMAIANGGKNAIKEMARILRQLHGHAEFQIVSLNSGERRNVIPSSGVAVVAVDHHLVAEFTAKAESISKDQAVTDEQIKVSVERFEGVGSGSGMLTRQTTLTLIEILSKLPHGVIRWDEKIIGLPMTSTNLATVSTDDEEMLISLMSRSSVTDELESVRASIGTVSKEHGAAVNHANAYPGWKPDPESRLLAASKGAFSHLFGKDIKISATHCGLECGVIAGHPKFAGIDAVSLGPTITDPHSVREKLDIASVAATYDMTKDILKRLAINAEIIQANAKMKT